MIPIATGIARLSCGNSRSHRIHEAFQLRLIEFSVGANTTANVQSEWTNDFDCLGSILGPQSAGKKHRYGNRLADTATDFPVMPPARPAQFLDRETRFPGI